MRQAYRRLLGNRSFMQVWSATVVSGLGDRIATIALFLLVYKLTGRALDLGLLAAVQILPTIVLGPVTGVLVDRWDRSRVMVVSDLCSAVVVAAIPFASDLGTLYLLAGLLAVGRQFTGPARLALVPDLVAEDELGPANALTLITRNLLLLVGPALGGALVATLGTDWAFWIDAVTFVASAAILLSRPLVRRRPAHRAPALEPLHAPAGGLGHAADVARAAADDSAARRVAAGSAASARAERGLGTLRAGASLVLGNPQLRFAFVFFGAMTFVTAMQQPLVVAFVKEALDGSDVQLGLIISAAGLGGIIGAPLGALGRGMRRPLHRVAALLVVDGLLLVFFAVNRSFTGALVLFAAFGALGSLGQVAIATFLQRETPEAYRGRVFGWLGTWIGPLSLASVFLGPLAAGVLGAAVVLGLSGAFELLVGAGGALLLRRQDAARLRSAAGARSATVATDASRQTAGAPPA
ncbi:MAG: MFS transporter [Candidatus Krumholzibacteriia bacterium]